MWQDYSLYISRLSNIRQWIFIYICSCDQYWLSLAWLIYANLNWLNLTARQKWQKHEVLEWDSEIRKRYPSFLHQQIVISKPSFLVYYRLHLSEIVNNDVNFFFFSVSSINVNFIVTRYQLWITLLAFCFSMELTPHS